MNRYILNIVDACSDMEFGAWIKLLVVPLAGWRNALDLAPQLPPVAVHVFLVMVKSVGRCIFDIMYVLVFSDVFVRCQYQQMSCEEMAPTFEAAPVKRSHLNLSTRYAQGRKAIFFSAMLYRRLMLVSSSFMSTSEPSRPSCWK